ncbi:MAG: AraC family transcriptional regulator [Bacteroidota bacterium]
MPIDYRDRYYDHFSGRTSQNPPKFTKKDNYIMRFHSPLEEYRFDNNTLSIIFFKKGVGQLRTKARNLKIRTNSFVVANPSLGWHYLNDDQEYIDVHSFVIGTALYGQFWYYCTASPVELLDEPFQEKGQGPFFWERTFGADHYRSGKLLQYLYELSGSPEYETMNPHELLMEVLQAIYQDQCLGHTYATKIHSKKASTQTETLKRLLTAYEYIQDNITESISLDQLSQISALSKYHIYNSFKTIFGRTPHQYINRQKLIKARAILPLGRYSVSEVAHLLGYPDLPTFSKLFKKAYGLPPSLYLKGKGR